MKKTPTAIKFILLIFVFISSCTSFSSQIKKDKLPDERKAYFFGRFLNHFGKAKFSLDIEKTHPDKVIRSSTERKLFEIKYDYDLCDKVFEVSPGYYQLYRIKSNRYPYELRVTSKKILIKAGYIYYIGDWQANFKNIEKRRYVSQFFNPTNRFKTRIISFKKKYKQLFNKSNVINLIGKTKFELL